MIITIDSARQLRDLLVVTLGDLLGVCRFDNGLETEAIFILNGGEQHPPPLSVVMGLEVVIIMPSVTIGELLGGYVCENTWTINLKQWDSSKNATEATKRVLGVLGNIKQVIPVPPSKKLGIPEGVQIKVSDFESILLK